MTRCKPAADDVQPRVFEEAARESPTAMPDTYERLLAAEKEFWRLFSSDLEARSIRFVDCLPALRECIRSRRPSYSESADGHPSPTGHEVIARVSSRRWAATGC